MSNVWRLFWIRIGEILTGHKHEWGEFTDWGFICQQRICKTCKQRQVLDK